MAQETAATNGNKRSRDETNTLSPPSADLELKRRKFDDAAAADGPSPGNRLASIASALSGVFGYNRSTPDPSQENIPPGDEASKPQQPPPQPPLEAPVTAALPPVNAAPVAAMSTQTRITAVPPARIEIRIPTSRPAIKLKALKGTKWDTSEDKPPPRVKAAASRPPPTRKPAAKPRGRNKAVAAPAPAPAAEPAPAPVGSLEQSADVPQATTSSIAMEATVTDGTVTDSTAATDVATNGTAAHGAEPEPAVVRDASIPTAIDTPTKNRLFSPVAANAPKSILTPTKKRGPRPSKNVKFDGTGLFDHIPRRASARKPGRPKKLDEPVDEITCGICAKPHSKPPNEIILCDNCDFAVHQECYGIQEIPEGDWLCNSCTQEDVLKLPKAEPGLTPAPTPLTVEVPEIPNLDRHLGAMQRVLLDRCAGRRRIRMFGQDEASEKVRQLVEQTVLAGEGNSMLLIGPRGSGKTTVCLIIRRRPDELLLTYCSSLRIRLRIYHWHIDNISMLFASTASYIRTTSLLSGKSGDS